MRRLGKSVSGLQPNDSLMVVVYGLACLRRVREASGSYFTPPESKIPTPSVKRGLGTGPGFLVGGWEPNGPDGFQRLVDSLALQLPGRLVDLASTPQQKLNSGIVELARSVNAQRIAITIR